MQLKPKTAVFSALLLFLIFSSLTSRAQFMTTPGTFRPDIKYNPAFIQLNLSPQLYIAEDTHKDFNLEYTFTVVMKDSSTKHVTSKIYFDDDTRKNYLLSSQDKIFPSQTQYLTRVDSNNVGNIKTYISGLPADSCWQFKVMKGGINAYSYLSEPDDADNFVVSSIFAIQKGDGPIEPISRKNLREALVDDKKAVEIFDTGAFYKALKQYNKDAKKKKN